MIRTAEKERKTTETQICAKVNLDGEGVYKIESPLGFLNHMLEQLSKHSGIDMELKIKGDTNIDAHHTVEDTAIILGQTLNEALFDCKGIERYGAAVLVMDETRCDVALDLGGRAKLVYNVEFFTPWVQGEDFDYSLIKEFMEAFASNLKATIHINLVYGENNHHIAEAVFKGLARALKQALKITGSAIPSTKGVVQ